MQLRGDPPDPPTTGLAVVTLASPMDALLLISHPSLNKVRMVSIPWIFSSKAIAALHLCNAKKEQKNNHVNIKK